ITSAVITSRRLPMWISPDGEIPVEISCGPGPCLRISSAISSAQCVSRTWTMPPSAQRAPGHESEVHRDDVVHDQPQEARDRDAEVAVRQLGAPLGGEDPAIIPD